MKKMTMDIIEKKIVENKENPRKLKHWKLMKEGFGKKKKGLVEIEDK